MASALLNKRFGWHSGSLKCRDATITGDMSIEGDMSFGDASTDTLTVNGAATFSSTVDFDDATTYTPTVAVDTSMYPIRISYNYPGATMNTGVDMDCYGIRSTITQTTSNDKATLGQRGYLQGMRSDIHLDGFADVALALYGKVYVDGASSVNDLYAVDAIMGLSTYTVSLDESGQAAAINAVVSGSGDVTCAGTGYGKVSGMHISWTNTNGIAMTVDSCGIYIGVSAGATLDSGYRVNASGTLTTSFWSYNSSGTMTNVIKVDGAHSYFANFDDATTCAATITSSAAATIKAQVLVKTPAGDTGYINVYGTTGT